LERFLQEFKATGIAARGWAWLAWDYDFERLMIYIGDEQNTFPVWNATPILALDVFEHAYFIDFGTRKADYIDAFFRNLDWDDVATRYETARRIAPNAPRLGVNFAS
jgi:Fe-Mn family superoxide dismutase